MIAVQKYFHIETPLDICVLNNDTKTTLGAYLTLLSYHKFIINYDYIWNHISEISNLIYEILYNDNNFKILLTDNEIKNLNENELKIYLQNEILINFII